MTTLQRLRLAATLAHSVPGVSLRLVWRDGRTTEVSDNGDGLRPGELRHLVSGAVRYRADAFVGGIDDVEITEGLVDIGAGVYASGCPQRTTTRWITSFLHPQKVADIARRCPHDPPGIEVRVVPDQDLGVTVAAVHTGDGMVHDLELTAAWLNTELIVREAMEETATSDHIG